jgi:hypothetical protein
MTDTDGKATIALVYKVMGELRTELRDQVGELDAKMEARFDALLLAVNDLRDGMVSRPVCTERHEASAAAIAAAVHESESDREKLWGSVHSLELQLRWAAGIVITAFMSVIVYLINNS